MNQICCLNHDSLKKFKCVFSTCRDQLQIYQYLAHQRWIRPWYIHSFSTVVNYMLIRVNNKYVNTSLKSTIKKLENKYWLALIKKFAVPLPKECCSRYPDSSVSVKFCIWYFPGKYFYWHSYKFLQTVYDSPRNGWHLILFKSSSKTGTYWVARFSFFI